ncbi:MAG TPA: ester cyclase [Dehalococcoidia bacterium]|nr:ester cyclase [Dehalococcoidia bacterium]
MSEPNRALGLHFVTRQDQMRGGPDPALCAPGYTARINGQVLDLAGHTALAGAFYAAFPDLNHILEDTVADEAKVAVRFHLEGTHKGDFMGVAATGKRIKVEVIAILEVKDGKVTELQALSDQAGMMQQMGVQ